MAVRIKKGTVALQLPVTPMVDLVFNLLLFFIMATTFADEDRAEQERQLQVRLPVASEAQSLITKPRETLINIDQEGRYFVSGKAMSIGEVERMLKEATTNNPDRASVIIRADERCHWKFVVAAMNACTKARIRDYRVMTRPGAEGPAPK